MPLLNRRGFLATTSSALLVQKSSSAQTDYLSELYQQAKSEAELTWYVVYIPSDQAERHANLFSRKYPGIRVHIVRLTAQVAYQRLNQDIQSKVANCDVFASTDIGHYVSLKGRGLLMPYEMRSSDQIDVSVRKLDPDNTYHAVNAALVTLLTNSSKVKEDQRPTSWMDLLDPKWKGQIALGHPGYSGFVGTWVVQMQKLYGWDYFEKLAANNPHVGRSIVDTVTATVSGECSVGVGPADLALRSASRGNPISVSYAKEGAVLIITPSAIMANSRHPNASKLFMEFLYSNEAANEEFEEFVTPLRPDAQIKPGVPSLKSVMTIRPTIDEISKGIPIVTEKWRDTFGI